MTDDDHRRQNPPPTNPQPPPPPPPQPNFSSQIGNNHFKPTSNKYPNPPEITNPDAVTLRHQWNYAIRQYSKWYSHAWGTAIFAGLSFFALGWVIKGENPIPSFHTPHHNQNDDVSDSPSDSTDANPNPRP